MLRGIYRATYAFLPCACLDPAAAMESGFRDLIQEHFQLWWSSMPTYGNIVGYYSVSEPALEPGTDFAVLRNAHGMVVGPPRANERPHFLLTRKLSDPLSNWISHLDHRRRARF